MNILLTGINSFIGRSLGGYLYNCGHQIQGTLRKDRYGTFRPEWLGRSFVLDLADWSQGLPPGLFEGVDAVIHLAHDFGRGKAGINREATEHLCLAAETAGVGKQLFFSSYSARPDAVSEYGIIKYSLEQFFLGRGHLVIRPGLVIGAGGMFLRFLHAVRRYPVIPLPDGGEGEVPVVSIRQLCEVTEIIVTRNLPAREFNIFYPRMVSARSIVKAIAEVSGLRRFILPLPIAPLIWAAAAVTALGMKLPFDTESLKSYGKNQERRHYSSISNLVDNCDSLGDGIRQALRAFPAQK